MTEAALACVEPAVTTAAVTPIAPTRVKTARLTRAASSGLGSSYVSAACNSERAPGLKSSITSLPPKRALLECAFEFLPRGPQPRIHRVHVGVGGLGDLGHAHALDLGQHEHRSLALVELFEQLMQDATCFAPARELERIRTRVDHDVRIAHDRGGGVTRTLATSRAAVVVDDAHQDAEHPRLQCAAPLELVEPAVDRDEHFLHDVVDRALDDA